jgi:cytochrome c biogenesis protein
VYSAEAEVLGTLVPGGAAVEIASIPLRIDHVVPASGLLLKRDPGVPLVYAGFAIALAGGGLSLVATRQLWAVAEPEQNKLHVGGLCNRNLSAFAQELPGLLAELQQG